MQVTDRPYSVVIAVDLSDISETVIEHGLDAASRRGPADIHVISVVPTGRGFIHRTRNHDAEIEAVQAALEPRVTDIVHGFADTIDDVDEWRVRIHVRAGSPAEEIVDLIDEARADLVVMGRHGWDGARRGLVGSVSERVLRLGHCSTMLVQPTDYEPAEVEGDAPCPDCVAVRRASSGEDWFCQRHHDNDRIRRLSVGPGTALKPGGLF